MEPCIGVEPMYAGLQSAAFTTQPTRLMALSTSADLATSSVTGKCSTVELRKHMAGLPGLGPETTP
jgi:hypothetical protein